MDDEQRQPLAEGGLGKVSQGQPSVGDTAKSHGMSAAPREFFRSVPFELSSGDGLTFEGYAAVYDTPTRISGWEGEFDEQIARGAFARSIAHRPPVLMFEHGKHPLIGSMPLGTITNFRDDSRGLHIEARLSDNWLIQPVRDAVRDGAITGMSFRFSIPDGGDRWEQRGKNVPLRTLIDADVPELGPVVFPAYEPTTASVRSVLDRLSADFTGRSAQGAGGGDRSARPSSGRVLSLPTVEQQRDADSLRLRGILK